MDKLINTKDVLKFAAFRDIIVNKVNEIVDFINEKPKQEALKIKPEAAKVKEPETVKEHDNQYK